jgi:thymidylate kinase
VEPTTAIKRLKEKRSVMENLETQRKVRDVYLKFVASGGLLKIDGNGPKKDISKEILNAVLRLLENPSLRSLNHL